MIKKAKEESGNGVAAVAPAPDQIQAMIANTLKQIQEKKAALASRLGSLGSSTTKVPLPPPQVVSVIDPPNQMVADQIGRAHV